MKMRRARSFATLRMTAGKRFSAACKTPPFRHPPKAFQRGEKSPLGMKADWDCEITEEREGIRLNPDSAYVHNSLGVALERKGQIQAALRPGGVLLMGEGSEEGFESLNDLRVRLGLPAIPSTSADNVSAIRFREAEMEVAVARRGFSLDAKKGFSQFFTITRVLHPLLVLPQ